MENFWSVIVIARNEQDTIATCLRSAREALGDRSHELILVDSASTDATVARARACGQVKVIQLPEHPLLGPSLGRYAGQQVARGDWLLFLDGDMELSPDWVPAAEIACAQNPRLAGVAGEMEHRLPDGLTVQNSYPDSDYTDARYLGGSALYRRSAVAPLIGFNPYLRACEEEEWGARIRKSGHKLQRLKVLMTRHHPKFPDRSLRELLRRRGRGFYFGAGQLARCVYSHQLPISNPLKPISRYLYMMGILALGVIAAVAVGLGAPLWWLLGWLALLAAAFVLFAVKSRSLARPAYYFAEWIVAGPDVVRGLLSRPLPIGDFASQWREIGHKEIPE